MIHIMRGNMLNDSAEAYVNAVNTVGVMGKGIAYQVKQAFPDVFRQYEIDCKAGLVQVGKMHVVEVCGLASPRYIINFPTKKHWRASSKIEYVESGLKDLVRVTEELGIRSIAIPSLGCGNGGLNWKDVKPLIVEAFQSSQVDVHLYEPASAPRLNTKI